MNVKLIIKIAAMLIIYVLQPDLRFNFKLKDSKLPLFYPVIILVSVFDLLLFKNTSTVIFLVGTLTWGLCILAVHQARLFTEKLDRSVIHNTITVFFLLNVFVSFLDMGRIILETHRINPYMYQGNYQEYFINTGDYIKGLTFDTSTTNAVISAFGIIYFLFRQQFKSMVLCMAVLLFTVSNFINIMLMLVLLYCLAFLSNSIQKSMIAVCMALLVVFIVRVSPQNNRYTLEIFKKAFKGTDISTANIEKKALRITDMPDSMLSPDQRKQKIATLYLDSLSLRLLASYKGGHRHIASQVKPLIPTDSIHTATFQSRRDTDLQQKKLLSFISLHKGALAFCADPGAVSRLPGKLVSFEQTAKFLQQHPAKLLTGDGMGNFSSKLAFRTTGLDISGSFPVQYSSISPEFLANHLDVYLGFFSKQRNHHSLVNSPNSTINQLAGEYGLIGSAAFVCCYLGFFIKRYKSLSYGLPLLLLMSGVFLIDYWFEQLSVVVLFELMMFIDMKDYMSLKPVCDG